MLRIGITGGIGSGKSTISKIFQVLGVPVFNADDAAKELMNTDPEIRASLIGNFGPAVYEEGQLNRAHLAALVFDQPEQLRLLNAIVHPRTIAAADDWMQEQTTPYVIKEAALLFESDAHLHLDKIIGVSSPLALRIERVMQRDHSNEEAVLARISRQMDETEKMRLCDYVITNDETLLVIPQVLKLHEQFTKMAANIY